MTILGKLGTFVLLGGSVVAQADNPTPPAPWTQTPQTSVDPILTTLLPDRVIYWRIGSFPPQEDWLTRSGQIEGEAARTGGTGGRIIDLRDSVRTDDISGAARFLWCLFPADMTWAKFRGEPLNPHAWTFSGPVVVLIDNHTDGVAAALAARLKADGALVIGQPTQPSTTASIIRLPDGSVLDAHQVLPDIEPALDAKAEAEALALIGQGRVLDVIAEAAGRPHLNEAALLRGDDPEEDADLAAREAKAAGPPPATAPVPQDIVLVSALDSLKAIQLSQRRSAASAER